MKKYLVILSILFLVLLMGCVNNSIDIPVKDLLLTEEDLPSYYRAGEIIEYNDTAATISFSRNEVLLGLSFHVVRKFDSVDEAIGSFNSLNDDETFVKSLGFGSESELWVSWINGTGYLRDVSIGMYTIKIRKENIISVFVVSSSSGDAELEGIAEAMNSKFNEGLL